MGKFWVLEATQIDTDSTTPLVGSKLSQCASETTSNVAGNLEVITDVQPIHISGGIAVWQDLSSLNIACALVPANSSSSRQRHKVAVQCVWICCMLKLHLPTWRPVHTVTTPKDDCRVEKFRTLCSSHRLRHCCLESVFKSSEDFKAKMTMSENYCYRVKSLSSSFRQMKECVSPVSTADKLLAWTSEKVWCEKKRCPKAVGPVDLLT